MKSNKMNGLDFGKYGRTLISLTTQHTAQNSSTNPYITSLNQTRTHTNVVETKRTLPNWNNCQKLNQAGNYLLKVDNRNTRKRCEACSKLTIKTLERHHWRRSGVFIVNFEHISHLALVSLLLTLNI